MGKYKVKVIVGCSPNCPRLEYEIVAANWYDAEDAALALAREAESEAMVFVDNIEQVD